MFYYSPVQLAKFRDCGSKELIEYLETSSSSYSKIMIGTEYDYPYIKYLWYSRYPPAAYHQFLKTNPEENSVVLLHSEDKHDWNLGKYIFRHDYCPRFKEESVLYVGDFSMCKNKYDIKIFKEKQGDRLVFLEPDKKQTIYILDKTIYRLDGCMAYNNYYYEQKFDNPITEKEISENFAPFY